MDYLMLAEAALVPAFVVDNQAETLAWAERCGLHAVGSAMPRRGVNAGLAVLSRCVQHPALHLRRVRLFACLHEGACTLKDGGLRRCVRACARGVVFGCAWYATVCVCGVCVCVHTQVCL